MHTQSHKTHEKKRGTDKSDRILRNAQERLQGGAAFEPQSLHCSLMMWKNVKFTTDTFWLEVFFICVCGVCRGVTSVAKPGTINRRDARRQDDEITLFLKELFNNGKLSWPWNRPEILESTCRTVAHDVVLLTHQIYLYKLFFFYFKKVDRLNNKRERETERKRAEQWVLVKVGALNIYSREGVGGCMSNNNSNNTITSVDLLYIFPPKRPPRATPLNQKKKGYHKEIFLSTV